MGIFSEYINGILSFGNYVIERKVWLNKISELRRRPIIVYASDLLKNAHIDYGDILPFSDQLSHLDGKEVDIILETPGGSAEVVEDLVKMVRDKFDKVGVIVPGTAKSAGTIFTMAADEILMCPTSSLGPIDAQVLIGGQWYSADAFLKGLEKIMAGPAGYSLILQNISPAEIQRCKNAQNFSKTLVANWLKNYKFKFWDTHSSNGRHVTPQEKGRRADKVAALLSDQGHWLTHGRSIKMKDLEGMLKITNYAETPDLYDAITRYYTLLRIIFNSTGMFKIIETPETQIALTNDTSPGITNPNNGTSVHDSVVIEIVCPNCKATGAVQVRFSESAHVINNAILFPPDSKIICDSCGAEINLMEIRNRIEQEFGQKVV